MPPEIVIDSDDDIGEIIGNPDVNVILPPLEGDQNIIDPNPYYTDEEQVEDPGYTDDDIDFTVTASTPYRDRRNEILRRRSKRRALKTLAKKRARKIAAIKNRKTENKPIPELDENKIIIDEYGEVTLTDPDNMAAEFKSLVSYNQIVQLPPEQNEIRMDPITRNLILKRKLPKDDIVNVKKYIAGTNITNRNVWDATPAITIGEQNEINAEEQRGDDKEQDIKPFLFNNGLASVDINTMRNMPWVDFSVVLRENDAEKREEAIMTLLQNNLPDDNDRYYIYHDQEANTFSVEVDEDQEELGDLIERIYVIDAQLKLEAYSAKERKELKKRRKRYLEILNDHYGYLTLSRVFLDKMSLEKKRELEEQIYNLQQNLNANSDDWFYIFNNQTEEFELLKEDQSGDIARRITQAILRTNKALENARTGKEKRGLLKVKAALITYLKRVGMLDQAKALDD